MARTIHVQSKFLWFQRCSIHGRLTVYIMEKHGVCNISLTQWNRETSRSFVRYFLFEFKTIFTCTCIEAYHVLFIYNKFDVGGGGGGGLEFRSPNYKCPCSLIVLTYTRQDLKVQASKTLICCTDNPFYTDTRYNDKIRYNNNLTVKKPSLQR